MPVRRGTDCPAAPSTVARAFDDEFQLQAPLTYRQIIGDREYHVRQPLFECHVVAELLERLGVVGQ